MKFCNKCNVILNHNDSNCPLCGKYCNNDVAPLNYFDGYKQMDSIISYPSLSSKLKLNVIKQISLLVLLIMAASIIMNYLFVSVIIWFPYVIVGLLSMYISLFQTIRHKRRLYIQIQANTILSCLILFVIDMFATNLSGDVLVTGVPIVLGIAILTSNFLIIFSKESHGYFIALAFSCMWGIMPQLIVWIFALKQSINISILFIISIVNFVVILIFFYKKARYEFQKRFFIS